MSPRSMTPEQTRGALKLDANGTIDYTATSIKFATPSNDIEKLSSRCTISNKQPHNGSGTIDGGSPSQSPDSEWSRPVYRSDNEQTFIESDLCRALPPKAFQSNSSSIPITQPSSELLAAPESSPLSNVSSLSDSIHSASDPSSFSVVPSSSNHTPPTTSAISTAEFSDTCNYTLPVDTNNDRLHKISRPRNASHDFLSESVKQPRLGGTPARSSIPCTEASPFIPSVLGVKPQALPLLSAASRARFQRGEIIRCSSMNLIPGRTRRWHKIKKRIGHIWGDIWEEVPNTEDPSFRSNVEFLAKQAATTSRRNVRSTRTVRHSTNMSDPIDSLFVATETADKEESLSSSTSSLDVEEFVPGQSQEDDLSISKPIRKSTSDIDSFEKENQPSSKQEVTGDIKFLGTLYLVDGTNFECVMAHCEADFDGRLLVLTSLSSFESSKANSRMFIKIERISHLRQHLSDAFQFYVRDSKDGGDEYGLQFQNDFMAFHFRQLLTSSLLETTTPIITIECALAEYDTQNREFVILSKLANVSICQRPSDSETFLTVTDHHHDSEEPHRVFAEVLTRDINIWPCPQTNQLTFWGIHHQRIAIDKCMFLLEMDPSIVGDSLIKTFFQKLAVLFQDKNFLMPTTGDTIVCSKESIPDLEDEDFDMGPLGDESIHKEWKSHHRRTSLQEEEESEDEDSVEEIPVYSTGYPLYSAEKSNVLTHRFMEVGNDRTFVCRGDQTNSGYYTRSRGERLQMKVYKKGEEDGEETLTSVASVGGDKEKKLLVAPESSHDGSVFLMDLAAEKIVQKWDANGTSIATMFPTFKKGQASTDPTFICSNPRNIFMMDTRIAKNAKSTTISYLTNPQLSVGTTDTHGHIAMGSRLGEIRLYDGQANAKGDFKRAKTLLQSIKEPIIAVDVTQDGSWIVATTKTFLVVYCTKLAGSGTTGFVTALGQHKPAPRYLMLSGDDLIKYQITDISFAPAKFDAEEDSIVTSTGNMAVVWDFGTVKRGKPFYSVRFAEDAIRDVQIATDSSDVVVAYPTAVGLFGTEKRKI